jgi:Trypsin
MLILKLSSPIEFHQGLSFPGCGTNVHHQSDDNLKATAFLINGSDSPQGSAPWHASLSLKSSYQHKDEYCGGSLISLKAVLTGNQYLFFKNFSSEGIFFLLFFSFSITFQTVF